MSKVDNIIKAISEADEVEIMEFDFDPCFEVMKKMEAALLSFKSQYRHSPWIQAQVDDALK